MSPLPRTSASAADTEFPPPSAADDIESAVGAGDEVHGVLVTICGNRALARHRPRAAVAYDTWHSPPAGEELIADSPNADG